MNKNQIIGREFNLDLGSLAPVEMVVRDVTEDKVIVEYLDSTSGRMEEFTVSEFEYFAGIKINENDELDNTEATLFNQLILVRYNIDALKFGTYIDEFRHKEIIKSYDILTDMIFKYIEKLKQNENE